MDIGTMAVLAGSGITATGRANALDILLSNSGATIVTVTTTIDSTGTIMTETAATTAGNVEPGKTKRRSQ